MSESPFLTTAEAALWARRSADTIRDAIQAGLLPATQPVRHGRWLIHRDDLKAYTEGRGPKSHGRTA